MSCEVVMYGLPPPALGEPASGIYCASTTVGPHGVADAKIYPDCKYVPPHQQLQQVSLRGGGGADSSQSHGSSSSWTRPPPPTYNHVAGGIASPGSSSQGYTVLHTADTPPPLVPPPAGSQTPPGVVVSTGCMCPSCSYTNRVPQYHHPPPPPPVAPPHLAQQATTWQQHPEHSYPPGHPPGHMQSHSTGHQPGHHDVYAPPPTLPPPPMSTSYMHERNNNETPMVSPSLHTTPMHEGLRDIVPQDPREWSSADVIRWIQWATQQYKLRNTHPERFQMNGKALCLMDLSMFIYRVPDGGEKLYQDFQCRLQKALYQDKIR